MFRTPPRALEQLRAARPAAGGRVAGPAADGRAARRDPWMDVPRPYLPGAGAHVPLAADAAKGPREPDGDGAGAFPGGVWALQAAAVSGGPRRPHRLLYPDDTVVDWRAEGGGPVWTGIAVGAVPAGGCLRPGWLQVVRRCDDALTAVHPAVMSPWSVDPYAWTTWRQRARFCAFDAAEAAGDLTACLAAALVEQDDRIIAAHVDTGKPAVHTVLDVARRGDRVLVCSIGVLGDTVVGEHLAREFVDVAIPPRHPAEDRPNARALFAAPPAPAPEPARAA